MPEYQDDYPTCRSTYATLGIYSDDCAPPAITALMGCEPTRTLEKGERLVKDRPSAAIEGHTWLLSSKDHVSSRDCRRHIDWLLDRLEPLALRTAELQAKGCTIDIFCCWLSKSGHGGPTLSPHQLRRLAECSVTIGFDCYFTTNE
jgi:hypothetical protein